MKKIHRLTREFFSRMFLVTILLTLFQTSLSAQQWKELHTGVTEDLYDVCCIDTSTVFVCGQNGVILKTTDGGESWVKLYEKPDNRMTLVAFADELTGYSYRDSIVIDSGPLSYHNRQLLKTTDGGTTWMELGDPYLGFPSNVEATGLYCLDTSTLLICSDVGIRKSSDGGLTFRTVPSAAGNMPDFNFEDHVGYFVDRGFGVVFKSTDDGETWNRVYECDNCWDGFMAMNFRSKDSISMFVRHNHNRIDTYDGFETLSVSSWNANAWFDWELLEATGSPSTDYEFTSSQNGCFISYWTLMNGDVRNVAFITNDGGNTWKFCYDGLNCYNSFWAIDGIDTVYYIAAGHGIVYRTGTPDWIYPWDLDETPTMNEPLIYPNPVENMLSFDGSDAELVEVFDSKGRKLFSSQVDGSFTLDTSQYPPGVYMIRITNKGGKTSMKKVIKKNSLK